MKSFNKLLLRKQKEYTRKKGKGGGMKIKTGLDKIWREVNLLKKLRHENVLSLTEIMDDEEGDKLHLILDNCEHGEIMTWDAHSMKFTPFCGKETFDEDQIIKYMKDILTGVEYLHS